MKGTADLKDWELHYDINSVNIDTIYVLKGNIYNDSEKRFDDGKYVRTSKIEVINFKEGWAESQNTKYTLK